GSAGAVHSRCLELRRSAVGQPLCRADRRGHRATALQSRYARRRVRRMNGARPLVTPARLCALCGLLLAVLAWYSLRGVTGVDSGLPWASLTADGVGDITRVLIYYGWLPRFAAALLAGAGLALAGVLLQQT